MRTCIAENADAVGGWRGGGYNSSSSYIGGMEVTKAFQMTTANPTLYAQSHN